MVIMVFIIFSAPFEDRNVAAYTSRAGYLP